MKKNLWTKLVTGLLFWGIVQSASATTIDYNLSNEWSDTSNPNGVWAFYSGTTLMTIHHYWYETNVWDINGTTNPSWAKRNVVESGWNDSQVGDIVAQAWWYGTESTNVTWTSPLDGVIDIFGRSWDTYGQWNDQGLGRDGGWSLDVNDVVIAQRNNIATLTRDQIGANFADNLLVGMSLNNITVNAGDVVKFSAVGRSTSGVDLNISLNTSPSAVPEPGTILLLGSALIGLAGINRKKII